MTITPFFTLVLRGKKDAIHARQKARRVASLLGFDPQEQACIAAGTFVVAVQALTMFRTARLCFQIENHQLHVFSEDRAQASDRPANRITGLLRDGKSPLRLAKPLPSEPGVVAELDVGWLVNKVEETACTGIFEEIVRQNQEMLTLLHELRLYQASQVNLTLKEEKPPNPHAA